MVMMESAPDPLEPIFHHFEKVSGWKLSQQARTILKEGLISVRVDTLGLGSFAAAVERGPVAGRVVELMPEFLAYLKTVAETHDKVEKLQKTIGGVFVLQHIGRWQSLFGCSCWPI